MKIKIQTIPHDKQRYPTAGDYWELGGTTYFTISELADERYEWLVLIHELVEYFIVKISGIAITHIDQFDMQFELERAPGNLDEPGDDPRSPYFMAHQVASMVERICAFAFGVLWKDYEGAIYLL